VDLAMREGIRNIIMTHHDPRAGEAKEERMLQQALNHCQKQLEFHKDLWVSLGQPEGPRIQLAYDGLEFDLTRLPPRHQLPKYRKNP
jgi:hypothetical protein